jgi:hypothetical protein
MPESVTDRPTKSHEQLFLLAKGQWKSRVVKFANLPGEHFHLLQNLGSNRKPVGFPAGLAIDFAASIFDLSQLQQNFTLPPFYSEVWQQSANGSDSDFIRCLPVEHRPAVWAARFLTAKATTKEFFGELNRFFVTLPNGDDLLKAWTSTSRFDSPHITGDGEGTVTVHYPGQICKVDLVHGEITISEPKGCVYFYDADAVREDSARPDLFDQTRNVYAQKWNDEDGREYERRKGVAYCNPLGRNRRTVWTIATEQYPEAHFATFPRKLVQPCILAGCPEHACPKCGAPWVREVEAFSTGKRQKMADGWDTGNGAHGTVHRDGRGRGEAGKPVMGSRTIGEHPTCACGLAPIGGTVLDPFGGSGTTAEVALEYGRRAILIELKPEYVELAKRRLDPVAGRPMLDFVGGGNE